MMTYITKLHVGLDFRQVFIYRNSLDTIRSWLALMSFDPYLVALRVSTDAVWFSNISLHEKYFKVSFYAKNER